MTESITPSGGTIHVLQSKPWLIKPKLDHEAIMAQLFYIILTK